MNLKFNKKNYKSNLVEFSEYIFQKIFFFIYIIKVLINKIFVIIKMSHSITQKNINSGSLTAINTSPL